MKKKHYIDTYLVKLGVKRIFRNPKTSRRVTKQTLVLLLRSIVLMSAKENQAHSVGARQGVT